MIKAMPNNNQSKPTLSWLFIFIVLLWIIESAKHLFDLNLTHFGVYPGSIAGLQGILFAPVIHGSWEHLAANTTSVLILGAALFYGYPKSKWWTVLTIWLVSGFGVWLFGRDSYHIGASGLTHGLFYFLFLASILRRDKRSIALMLIAVFMHGSMLLGVLPWDPEVSFEGHLFGGLGGVLSALLFRKIDPKPIRKVYDWELEELEEPVEPGEDYWNQTLEISSSENADQTSRSIDSFDGSDRPH